MAPNFTSPFASLNIIPTYGSSEPFFSTSIHITSERRPSLSAIICSECRPGVRLPAAMLKESLVVPDFCTVFVSGASPPSTYSDTVLSPLPVSVNGMLIVSPSAYPPLCSPVLTS